MRGKAAIANAKLAYEDFRAGLQHAPLGNSNCKGARVQRPLWASTGTKNPAYSDTIYVDNLIGPETVNTVPPATLDAFREHGIPETTLTRDLDQARDTFAQLEDARYLDGCRHSGTGRRRSQIFRGRVHAIARGSG